MSLTDNKRNNGFTLVELLVVIVVIGILAAISIVAYNGIQQRARGTKAQVNASTVQKAAEGYFADGNSAYPTTVSAMTASTALITVPSAITVLTAASTSTIPSLSGTNGENSIMYRYVLSSSVATGACIFYWDFAKSGGAAVSAGIFLGTATSANCSATVGANGNTPTS